MFLKQKDEKNVVGWRDPTKDAQLDSLTRIIFEQFDYILSWLKCSFIPYFT